MDEDEEKLQPTDDADVKTTKEDDDDDHEVTVTASAELERRVRSKKINEVRDGFEREQILQYLASMARTIEQSCSCGRAKLRGISWLRKVPSVPKVVYRDHLNFFSGPLNKMEKSI